MTAPDPAAKEEAHEPTPEPARKKGDELTAKELKEVVGGVRDVAAGLASGKRTWKG
ncbi:MAG: hypothetical protein WAN75_43205 [Xanthobacteraceae bacterium]|jgi:bacteriocin-like protein